MARAPVCGLLAAVCLLALALPSSALRASAADANTCEVCVKVVSTVAATLTPEEAKNEVAIEDKFREYCKTAVNKENRFCYYVGGTEDAATGMLREISRPLISGLPHDKVCERLKKKDAQICELKYDKPIDLKAVDINKLRVKELRKVLADWGEECKGCAEKSDFIRKINEVRGKHEKSDL
eukprot:Opistho-1_new@68116